MGVVPNIFLRPMEPAVRRTLSEIVPMAAPVNAEAVLLPAGEPPAAPAPEAR